MSYTQSPIQAVIVDQNTLNDKQSPLYLALFNADGTPVDIGSGGGTVTVSWNDVTDKPATFAATVPVASATKLVTARTIQTNLASAATASFDGSANATPGVTGVLPVANGGTGNGTGLAATATKLATAQAITLTGAVTGTVNFDGSAGVSITTAAGTVVPTTRTVNAKALSANIVLAGSDVAITGYAIGSGVVALSATDTVNAALAKIEARLVALESA